MWKLVVSSCLLTILARASETTPDTYTFAIFKNQKPKCLGVAVGEKYVVTSAHCVYGSAASSLSVKTFTQTVTVSEVLKVFVHPYYTPPSPDYDIALLKIKPTLPNLQGLLPAKTEPLLNETVNTVYWDLQNNTISLKSVKIEDRKSCKSKVGNFVTGRMICAYDGDSSLKTDGPLILNNSLVGVPSKRIESNQGILPAIYTNIANSEIYSFIDSYI